MYVLSICISGVQTPARGPHPPMVDCYVAHEVQEKNRLTYDV